MIGISFFTVLPPYFINVSIIFHKRIDNPLNFLKHHCNRLLYFIFYSDILFNVCAFEFVKCTTSATAIAKTSSLSNTLFLKGILQKILHPYNKD
jgi:hypothetical protein